MRRWIKGTLLLVALAGAATGVYLYLQREEVTKVTVVEASLGSVEESVSATGAMQPTRTILVTVEPGARVTALYFKEQDPVQKGQVLARLDDTDLVSQLDQHEANLRLLQASLTSAELNVQRLRRLLAKGFAARQEVETAEHQVSLNKTQIEERTLAISLVKAKQQRALVVAPITGVVTRSYIVEGGIIADTTKGFTQTQPTAIAEIADVASSEFSADIDQADIVKIQLLQKATVRLDPFPEQVLQARTRQIGLASIPDPSGRVRYQVKLQVDTPAGLVLKVGMSGTATFVLAQRKQVVTLPPPLILQQGEDEFVFLMEGDRARLKKIKTGLHGETGVEVISGVQAGDLVIDQGRVKLKDGRRVERTSDKR